MTTLRLLASGAFAAAPAARSSLVPPLGSPFLRPSAASAAFLGTASRSGLAGRPRCRSQTPAGMAAPPRRQTTHASGALSRLAVGGVDPLQCVPWWRRAPWTTTAGARLFGSKRGAPSSPPGEITVIDNSAAEALSLPSLERTLSDLRLILGYPSYDVTLVLTDDEEMRLTNLETRGVDGPTDVLSFPFQDCRVDGRGRAIPGALEEPEFDLDEYYNLGDLMVDVPYVLRRIKEDRTANEGGGEGEGWGEGGGVDDGEGGETEYSDVAVADDDDRGVSAAMSTEYDLQRRIEMLLVHGMLHLVGYDHVEDEDYEIMVTREEEVLRELEGLRRMGRGGGEEEAGREE